MANPPSQVDVVIVNYGTPQLSVLAVDSVLASPEVAVVAVVDNGSPDDSLTILRDAYDSHSQVKIIETPRNLGFGAANNLGSQKATAPYLFFLNSDAQVRPGCVQRLVQRLEADPGLGIVAPQVFLADGITRQEDTQGSFPTVSSLLTHRGKRHQATLAPDWVSGVACMVRREEFASLKGFDERLFMYFEDVDLCRRYQEAGKGVACELSAEVVHQGGGSRQSTAVQKMSYYRSQDGYLLLSGALPLGRLLVKIARSPYILLGKLFLWK